MAARRTVADLRALKGNRQILTIHVDTVAEASAAAEAGIDMFTCEADENLPRFRAAAPGVFIQAGPGQGVLSGPETAIREGFRAMDMGADAVYFAGSLHIVEAMAREGIPVTGHVGFVPRWRTWTNVRAVGKNADEAVALYRKVKDLENAGAWAVEMEIVPVEVADFITRGTSLITEGMGCGAVCDTQYLFSCDVLGTNTGHYPRHAKKYADMAAEETRLQQMRIDAFRAFARDVELGMYPQKKHEIHVGDEVLNALAKAAQ
jgi:3-methyl-2-oxobutanoate hydroxymethyltransferase